jgi:hypothetical protein
MSYRTALEVAGADILDYQNFGSYQGDWIAEIIYKGQYGFVHGYYGSCSGCDAFESEFGWSDEEDDPAYPDRLKAFGERYLDDILNYEQMLEFASQNLEWDTDAEYMVKWVKSKDKSNAQARPN